jgi:drug/metabolite transporter (DMT)-like permease
VGRIAETRIMRSEALLLLTAAIWGFAFVAQRAGMQYVGPFTFNAVRFAMGSAVLVPVILLRRRCPSQPSGHASAYRRLILGGAVLAGSILFVGASLQQTGIVYTTAGKAGFITGLYVIIVPIVGLAWGRRPGSKTWSGAGLAVGGLYLLSITGTFTIGRGDLLVLVGAFAWAGHVITIGWLSPRVDAILLACLQFAVCSALSFLAAFAVEHPSGPALVEAVLPILYAGLLSTGVAYTLQVVAQRRVPAAPAAIIMSLEAVFAGLGGWLMLDETLSGRGLIGCGLMLAGMVISQLDPKVLHATSPMTVKMAEDD